MLQLTMTAKNGFSSGVAALMTIVIITAFLLAISFFILTKGTTSIDNGQYEAQSARAQFVAELGIQDGLLKLARDQTASTTYTLADVGWTVDIWIAQGSPVLITATSTIIQGSTTVRRTIQASVTLNSDGKITAITKTNL